MTVFSGVLAQYSAMVRNNFYMVLRDTGTYESSFGEDIGVGIRTHKQDIYYTFYILKNDILRKMAK